MTFGFSGYQAFSNTLPSPPPEAPTQSFMEAMCRVEFVVLCLVWDSPKRCIWFKFKNLFFLKFYRFGAGSKKGGRGSYICGRTLFVSCCTSGAINHPSNLLWIWHQEKLCFFADRFQFDNCSFKYSLLPSMGFFTDLSLQMLLFQESAPPAILVPCGCTLMIFDVLCWCFTAPVVLSCPIIKRSCFVAWFGSAVDFQIPMWQPFLLILFHWQAASSVEQAGQLKDILWSVRFYKKEKDIRWHIDIIWFFFWGGVATISLSRTKAPVMCG